MNVGQRIRETREDLGMQGAALARRVGVSRNTIYRIERGERTPSMALLERIARELRTEPSELLKGPAVPAGKAEAPAEAGQAKTTRVKSSYELRWRVEAAVNQLLDDPQEFTAWRTENPERAEELAVLLHAS
jgi:transcriptional regulator with XRE-family HTH domain